MARKCVINGTGARGEDGEWFASLANCLPWDDRGSSA